jgi:hypothetical protein
MADWSDKPMLQDKIFKVPELASATGWLLCYFRILHISLSAGLSRSTVDQKPDRLPRER